MVPRHTKGILEPILWTFCCHSWFSRDVVTQWGLLYFILAMSWKFSKYPESVISLWNVVLMTYLRFRLKIFQNFFQTLYPSYLYIWGFKSPHSSQIAHICNLVWLPRLTKGLFELILWSFCCHSEFSRARGNPMSIAILHSLIVIKFYGTPKSVSYSL